jgi:threonine/homoserine efflux transporter RhtA
MGGSFDKAPEQAAEIRKHDPLLGHRAFAVVYTAQKKPELAKKEYAWRAHALLGAYLLNAEKNDAAAMTELETALCLHAGCMAAWYYVGRIAASSGTNLPRGE